MPLVAVDSMIIDLLGENLYVGNDIAEAIEALEPPPVDLAPATYAVYWLVALAPFWRSGLLARGVSATMTAKAYRLLRAVLMTAVEEDKILPRNPCRIREAGSEQAPERPVLTVTQVFELAELVGRRPIGNVRQLAADGYRLRFQRQGRMQTAPEVYLSRPDAERALWVMALDGRTDCNHDRRYRALVLLATFASLRWGEATALRRGNFNRSAAWPQAVAAIGAPGLHFHDLRHAGNTFAAASGAGLRDHMARMGHDSERAAMIYQHEARGADQAITNAIDIHVQAEQRRDDDDGPADMLAPVG